MEDNETLLAAIRDNPDDDLPRRQYADWLEENGITEADRDRAEFIRLQLEIETLGRLIDGGHRLVQNLEERAWGLLRRHREAWLGLDDDGPCADYTGFYWVFRRGFPEFAHVWDFPRFRASLKEHARVQPVPVRGIRVWDADDVALARRSRLLSGLSELWIEDDPNVDEPHDLGALLARWRPRGTARLRVRGCPIPAAAVEALFPLLGELWLNGTHFQGGLPALPTSGGPGPLTRLWIYKAGSWEPGALACSPWLAGLTSLVITGLPVGPDGAEAFAGSPHLGKLVTLHLPRCAVRNDGAEALARSPNVRSLVALSLPGNGIDRRGVAALASSADLRELRYLDLSANPEVRAAGVQCLLDSPLPDRLEMLDLRESLVRGEQRSPAVRELESRMGGRLLLGGFGDI